MDIDKAYKDIHKRFTYKDGYLYWRYTSGRAMAGSKAGGVIGNGRWYVQIAQGRYELNRMVWLYHHGTLPPFPDVIDHINNDKLDNRIENLQVLNRSQNAVKSKLYANNTSGYTGVIKRLDGKWDVKYCQKYVGTRNTFDEAVELRKSVEVSDA